MVILENYAFTEDFLDFLRCLQYIEVNGEANMNKTLYSFVFQQYNNYKLNSKRINN